MHLGGALTWARRRRLRRWVSSTLFNPQQVADTMLTVRPESQLLAQLLRLLREVGGIGSVGGVGGSSCWTGACAAHFGMPC